MIGRSGKISLLQTVRNAQCTDCELSQANTKHEQHVCVMGKGNPMSQIILIGEAPGEEEAKTGLPFTGRCGRWLDEVLLDLKMTNMVYITNAVKCRPPFNRKPYFPDEILACSKYLVREIQIVEPKVFVTMGKTAFEAMGFKDASFSKAVGKIIIPPDQKIEVASVITWHPSYCLRMGDAKKREFVRDLKAAKELVV